MISYENYPGVEGSGPVGFLSRLEHRSLEKKSNFATKILEIGGGKGDHLQFRVPSSYDEYTILDLFKSETAPKSDNVKYVIGDVQRMQFSDSSFDLVILTCVLHHLSDPLKALKEIERVVKPGGEIRILLSHDPGFAYNLGWKLFAQKNRLLWDSTDAKYAHAISHLLSGRSIEQLIKYCFKNYRVRRWGTLIYVPFWNLNVSSVFRIDLT